MGCKWLIGIHLEKFFFVAACSLVPVGLQLAESTFRSGSTMATFAQKYLLINILYDPINEICHFCHSSGRKQENMKRNQMLSY